MHGFLEARARLDPDAAALLAPGRAPLSFGSLLEQVSRVVASLNRVGVRRNDTIALLMRNGPEMASALLSISAGAAVAPLNPAYRERELDAYLADLDPKLLIIEAGLGSPARALARQRGIGVLELAPEEDREAGRFALSGDPGLAALPGAAAAQFSGPDDLALLLHTSGTTSQPKVVPLRQRNIGTSAADVCRTLGLEAGDRCLNLMPLYHVGGLVDLLLAPLSAGGSVVCTPGFSSAQLADWLGTYRPTWLQAVPAMLREMVGGRAPTASTLRFVRSVASALPDALRVQIEETFSCPVVETYGMTEASPLITSTALPPAPHKAGSLGRSVGPKIAILDPEGAALHANVSGEIAIRGDNVMDGYRNSPEANALAFRDGWFRTGDLGFLDEDGFLFLRGRVKEMINRGGEKISPVEIEATLLEHPGVLDAAAFAAPHRTLGEEVAAAVVPKSGTHLEPADIVSYMRGRLSDFKVPRLVRIVDGIPRNHLGKLQRAGLHEALGLRDAAESPRRDPALEPRDEIERALLQLWQDVLQTESLGIRDSFFDLGGSSLEAASMLCVIEEELGTDVPLDALLACETIEELAKLLGAEGVDGAALARIRAGAAGS